MAKLAGVFAASHGPLIARDWELLPPDLKAHMTKSFQELGRRFAEKNIDVVIEISPDHWVNFFLNNLPNVCIGVGDEHEGPPEPFMKKFRDAHTLLGDAKLANHILKTALKKDFEPSISHHLILDHGFCIPLMRMELPNMPKIIPVIVNDIEPPMISIKRAVQWGELFRTAIESYPGDISVGVLATGGLSHSIGEPTMGVIDEPFDQSCIEHFQRGAPQALIDFLEEALPKTGNGSQEVRNWVIAHAAASCKGFDLLDYIPAKEVYIGCAFAEWKL